MSDKIKFNISAPVRGLKENKMLINWIEEAISNKHIKYYDYKNFSNLKVIGSGGFGEIYSADWKNSRNTLALKSLKLNDVNNVTAVEKLIYEVITLYYYIHYFHLYNDTFVI